MSIYSDFEARLDSEQLKGRGNTRAATLILADNAGGDPLLGIQYSCDFRSEEETGVGKMSELFARTTEPSSFFAQEYLLQDGNKGFLAGFKQADFVFEDENLIAFSADLLGLSGTRSHSALEHELTEGLAYVKDAEAYSDGRSTLRWAHRSKSVPELKAALKLRGIKGYSKLKRDELISALVDDDYAKAHPEEKSSEVHSQPGWFHYGSLLIFEKKANLFNDVLQRLVAAAKDGYLVVGSGGIGFGSGFSFFDSRDLSEDAKAAIHEGNLWYREQMDLLKPVAEIVQQGPMRSNWGSAYYFLGKPTIIEDQVKYWLNGSSVKFSNGRSQQPFGYYSLQELLDEKYIADAAAKSDDDFKTFENGNYRKTKLTDEQAEEELKARGLSWASK